MVRKFDAPYEYEQFIRICFGYGTTGVTLNRYGDPAGTANTDCFGDELIHKVKAATAYAMLIMTTAIVNECKQISEKEYQRLDQFAQDVINAKDSNKISELIEQFKHTVLEQYFEGYNGRFRLKV